MWVKCAFEDYLSCLYTSRITCPIFILEEFKLEEKAILPICQQNNLSYKHTNLKEQLRRVISNPHYPILNAIKISVQFKRCSVQFKRCSDFTKQIIVKTYMYFEKKTARYTMFSKYFFQMWYIATKSTHSNFFYACVIILSQRHLINS